MIQPESEGCAKTASCVLGICIESFSAIFCISLHSLDALFNVNQIEKIVLQRGTASFITFSRMYQWSPSSVTTSTLRPNKSSRSASQSTGKKRRPVSPYIHQQVDIASLSGFAREPPSEDPHIKCAMLSQRSLGFFPSRLQ